MGDAKTHISTKRFSTWTVSLVIVPSLITSWSRLQKLLEQLEGVAGNLIQEGAFFRWLATDTFYNGYLNPYYLGGGIKRNWATEHLGLLCPGQPLCAWSDPALLQHLPHVAPGMFTGHNSCSDTNHGVFQGR